MTRRRPSSPPPAPRAISYRVVCSPSLYRPLVTLARGLSLPGAATLAATLAARARLAYPHRRPELTPAYAFRPDPPIDPHGQAWLALD